MERAEFVKRALSEPTFHGFKTVNIAIWRFDLSVEELMEMESYGIEIDYLTFVTNYRYVIVEHLIKSKKLNPPDFIHDLCLYPYHPDRHNDFSKTLKCCIENTPDLTILDSQRRTILECMKNNRSLHFIGVPIIKSEISRREKYKTKPEFYEYL